MIWFVYKFVHLYTLYKYTFCTFIYLYKYTFCTFIHFEHLYILYIYIFCTFIHFVHLLYTLYKYTCCTFIYFVRLYILYTYECTLARHWTPNALPRSQTKWIHIALVHKHWKPPTVICLMLLSIGTFVVLKRKDLHAAVQLKGHHNWTTNTHAINRRRMTYSYMK